MLKNTKLQYVFLILLLLLSLVFSVSFGAVSIPVGEIFEILISQISQLDLDPSWPAAFETIIMQVRLPHSILLILTGAALAGSGGAFQGLFRNPLADPYLIGVASGAGLGAVFALSLHWPQSTFGFFLIPLSAFAGGIITVFIVYQLAKVGKMVPLTTLILAGVAMGSFTSAITSFLMLRADDQLYRALSFLMGGSPVAGWTPVLVSIPIMIPGFLLLAASGHWLNVLQFGEEQAQQMGLRVSKTKLLIVCVATLMTSIAVAFSGVIGFIGLVIPHVVRLIWGADYRIVIRYSIFIGASALLWADMIARVLLAPQSIPVGIVTAMIGAPFFLMILRKAKKEVFW